MPCNPRSAIQVDPKVARLLILPVSWHSFRRAFSSCLREKHQMRHWFSSQDQICCHAFYGRRGWERLDFSNGSILPSLEHSVQLGMSRTERLEAKMCHKMRSVCASLEFGVRISFKVPVLIFKQTFLCCQHALYKVLSDPFGYSAMAAVADMLAQHISDLTAQHRWFTVTANPM
jgi:hypothetical protein